MSEIDLAAIEARCNAATPGPWRVGYATGRCTLPHVHGVGDCDYRVSWWDDEELHNITRDAPVGAPHGDAVKVCGNYSVESGGVVYECDAAFIAHARTDIPALLARVRELEAALDEMTAHRNAIIQSLELAIATERAVWSTAIEFVANRYLPPCDWARQIYDAVREARE